MRINNLSTSISSKVDVSSSVLSWLVGGSTELANTEGDDGRSSMFLSEDSESLILDTSTFFLIDECFDSCVGLEMLAPLLISSLLSFIYFLCDGESSPFSELLLS